MKWEILKGSEKDFEGMTDDILSILENDLGDRYPFHLSAIAPIGRWLSVAERLPITEPVVKPQLTTEWDGEYPIPSGTRVEVHFQGDDSRIWTEFLIEYMRDDVVVLYDFRNLGVESYKNEYLGFRPIRSPEDVARDKAIHAMSSSHKPCGHATAGICADIYDAIAAGKIPGIKLE